MHTDFTVGKFTVTRIEEMLTPGFDPAFLFPRFDEKVLEQHLDLQHPDFLDPVSRKLMSSMHSWAIRYDDHVILIDTGCGNDKVREAAAFQRFHMLDKPYLDSLLAAGIRPEDVTLVINTHLHVDHVGWNTQLVDGRWVPTFPNARYITGAIEMAHWLAPGAGLRLMPEAQSVIIDSVTPVIEAGLFETVGHGDRILPGLEVEIGAGHTAGQIFLKLEDGKQAAIFTGDSIHQPMQVHRPDWNSRFCEDTDEAIATRRRLLDFCADRGAILAPAHFGHPHAGHIRRHGDKFSFVPLGASGVRAA
jgi:glyoxylase-like metal-dependent hydrolase (beta-lactamase superfamily II)